MMTIDRPSRTCTPFFAKMSKNTEPCGLSGLKASWYSSVVIAFVAAILLSAGFGRTLGRWVREAAPKPRAAAEAVGCVLSIAVLVLSVASIASGSYNPFIYFQF